MIRTISIAGALLLAACSAPRTAVAPLAARTDFVIRNVAIVDVERGTIVPTQSVLIRGNRIVSIAPAASAVAASRTIDGTGRYLMPGLWDMHAHLTSDADSVVMLPLYVANGVTGMRDMWTDVPGLLADSAAGITMLEHMMRVRSAIRAGRMVGPRLLFKTAPLDGPFGPDGFVNVVRTPHEARDVVARAAANGVDVVGIYRWVGPEVYLAAATRARDAGLPVAGLAPIAATFAELDAAGQRTRDGYLEWELACSTLGDSVRREFRAAAARDAMPDADSVHGHPTLHIAVRPRLRETFDADGCGRIARDVARQQVWQTPRLVYGYPLSSAGAHGETAARYLSRDERAAWEQRVAKIRQDSAGLVTSLAAREREIYRILHAAGIRLLVGTESYFGSPATGGFSVHDELVELVGIGLSPAEALRAGTLEPARAMQLSDSLGSVAIGNIADLVLLDANPLEDIRNTSRIAAVVADGRLFDRAALDALRERARRFGRGTP